MFDTVDDTGAGCLDLEKFKAFSNNPEACQMFKSIMKVIREKKKS